MIEHEQYTLCTLHCTASTMQSLQTEMPKVDIPCDGKSLISYGLIRRSVMKVLDTILLGEV